MAGQPTREQLERQVKTLLLGAEDMDQAAAAAEALKSESEDVNCMRALDHCHRSLLRAALHRWVRRRFAPAEEVGTGRS